MQKKKRILLLRGLQLVSLAILLPLTYWVALKLLIEPIEYYVFEQIPTWLVFFIVGAFDVGWIMAMRMWPLRNINIKIILTLLVLTLSASVLSCLLALGALRDAFA
jgi:hypothetical protein